MKLILQDEIEVSPKLILWAGMPDIIDNDVIIKYLKSDILITKYPGKLSDVNNVNHQTIALFYNLDAAVTTNVSEEDELIPFIKGIIQEFKNIDQVGVFVQSSRSHSDEIEALFAENSVNYQYLENYMINPRQCLSLIQNVIAPMYASKSIRTSLRLNFLTSNYTVSLKTEKGEVSGHISDISLSGLGIIVDNQSDMDKFYVGQMLFISIDFKVIHLNISQGLIMRLGPESTFFGVKINPGDELMIDTKNSQILGSIIDSYLEKIVRNHALSWSDFIEE